MATEQAELSKVEKLNVMKRLITKIPPVSLIYDVGGSNGAWTWEALKVFPKAKIELFEPIVSDTYNEVLSAILNSGHNIAQHAVAIGSYDGTTSFFETPDSVSSTTLNWTTRGKLAKQRKVPIRTLDSMLENGEIAAPDIIKMDIQGGELNALKGGNRALQTAQALLLETWVIRAYGEETPLLSELMAYLDPLGFRIFDIGHRFRTDEGILYGADVCFIREKP